jgi:hypothetical protein
MRRQGTRKRKDGIKEKNDCHKFAVSSVLGKLKGKLGKHIFGERPCNLTRVSKWSGPVYTEAIPIRPPAQEGRIRGF